MLCRAEHQQDELRKGRAGQGRAGQGRASQGMAGEGRAGQGTDGQQSGLAPVPAALSLSALAAKST
jgi:hypothetical protein